MNPIVCCFVVGFATSWCWLLLYNRLIDVFGLESLRALGITSVAAIVFYLVVSVLVNRNLRRSDLEHTHW